MTKIIVQLYVENMLKLLKVLKTRTALKMNGLSRIPLRSIRQSAKALFKPKKPLTSRKRTAKIESRRGTGKILKTSSECQIGGWQRNRIDRNNSEPK